MARNMSFALTERQLLDGTKDVTRRMGWLRLKPRDRLNAVRKAMGLKKGEKIHVLAEIEVVSVRREQLWQITEDDCRREGFPEMGVIEFVDFFCDSHKGCTHESEVTRIEFRVIHPQPEREVM
jgi:hypothetical protein